LAPLRPHGEEEGLRRVLHRQEPGTGPDVSDRHAEVSHSGYTYRILAHQISRFTHYYFYIRDEVLGPIIIRVSSFFPFHARYWLNGHPSWSGS